MGFMGLGALTRLTLRATERSCFRKVIPMSRRSSFRWIIALAAISVVAGTACWYFLFSNLRERPPAPPGAKPNSDPRLAYAGPYKNVHPDVKAVGDAVCNSCHTQCKT